MREPIYHGYRVFGFMQRQHGELVTVVNVPCDTMVESMTYIVEHREHWYPNKPLLYYVHLYAHNGELISAWMIP